MEHLRPLLESLRGSGAQSFPAKAPKSVLRIPAGALGKCRGPFKGSVKGPIQYVDSTKLEHGCRMMYDGWPAFFGLSLEDGQVPTFWLLR